MKLANIVASQPSTYHELTKLISPTVANTLHRILLVDIPPLFRRRFDIASRSQSQLQAGKSELKIQDSATNSREIG